MALIKVLGWLKSPTGQPAINIPIKVTASESETVLAELFSDIKTDENGYYEFGLDTGRYLIEVLVSQTYHLSGNVTVDENTPNEITITDLVKYSPLVDVPVNKTPVTDWADALHDHQTQPDLVRREHRDQVVDGSTVVAEVLSTSTSETNSTGEAMTHNVTESGTVRVESSETAFEDSSTSNGFASKSDVVSTENVNHTTKVEIYEDTTTEILLENEVTTNDLNSTENTHLAVEDGIYTLDRERSLAITDGSVIENQSIDFNGVTEEGTAENARTINLDTSFHTASVEHVESIEQTYRDHDSIEVHAPRTTEEDTLRVDGGLHSIEVKETKTGLINKDDEPVGSVIRELIVNHVTAIERFFNNGLTTLKSYLVDDFKVVDRIGESVFHVDTVNKEVVLNARLTITNPEDFKGDNGDTIFEIYEYSTDAVDWHTVYVAGDLYRRFNSSVNGYVDPLNWSDPIKMFAEDGLQGDTLYIQFQYSTDQSNWHDVFVDGDVWRRERTITNGSPSTTWSDPARIIGADGIPGDTVTIEYEYSVNGLEPWHPNFSTGDHFRRERLVTNGVAGEWSVAAKLVPIKGDDYYDGIPGLPGDNGQTTYFHTAYADAIDGSGFSQIPTGKDYIGTYSDFTAEDSPNPNDYTWMLFKGAQGEDGTNGIPGENGIDGKTSYLHIAYADDASGNGFSQSPAGKTHIGQYVDFTQQDSSIPSKYTWAQMTGLDGIDGEDGNHGSGSYVVYVSSVSGIPSSTAGKDAHIVALADRPAQAGDMLTYNGNGSVAEDDQFSRQYLRGSSSWSEFTFRVDGSAVINGTLAAETLKSGTAVTDYLYVGNSAVTISGDGSWSGGGISGNRIWLGHSNPAYAPLRMTNTGYLFATNAAIGGSITATTGRISGTFYLGNANDGSDYAAWYGGQNPNANGESFRMVTDGKLRRREWYTGRSVWYKANGTDVFMDINPITDVATFNGDVLAERIIGEIVTARIYSTADKKVVNAHGQQGWTAWGSFDVITVSKASPKERVLLIEVLLRTQVEGTGMVEAVVYGQARMTGTFGTVTSPEMWGTGYFTNSGAESGNNWPVTLMVTVPANATGTMTLQVRASGTAQGAAVLKGVSGTNYLVQLITAGSDLS